MQSLSPAGLLSKGTTWC